MMLATDHSAASSSGDSSIDQPAKVPPANMRRLSSRKWATTNKGNTCSDCEDGHENSWSRKEEIELLSQSCEDKPDDRQEHPEIV